MKVKQISIFIENKPGRLLKVTRTLADAGINIRALSVADTVDYGLMRLIVDDYVMARDVLAEASVTVALTDVIAAEIPDVPGGLNGVVEILSEAGINIEYMYAFSGNTGKGAIDVFRVDDIEGAEKLLESKGVKTLSQGDVEKI
ncbi:MAG: ACT domain-containing protein [Abditibacteriota bacterium]|jgi:hypothetical protein|nr:ACT domain-containing protein [Abditibacteriota bacterium]MBP5737482.1 ACT domain-containing protein [Abditibacteriota bacterium]